jgi:hypothetical protein
MYLLYDVLQLRSASLRNAFLVKRRNWRATEDDIASLTIKQLEDAAKAPADGGVIDEPLIQRLQRNCNNWDAGTGVLLSKAKETLRNQRLDRA